MCFFRQNKSRRGPQIPLNFQTFLGFRPLDPFYSSFRFFKRFCCTGTHDSVLKNSFVEKKTEHEFNSNSSPCIDKFAIYLRNESNILFQQFTLTLRKNISIAVKYASFFESFQRRLKILRELDFLLPIVQMKQSSWKIFLYNSNANKRF